MNSAVITTNLKFLPIKLPNDHLPIPEALVYNLLGTLQLWVGLGRSFDTSYQQVCHHSLNQHLTLGGQNVLAQPLELLHGV